MTSNFCLLDLISLHILIGTKQKIMLNLKILNSKYDILLSCHLESLLYFMVMLITSVISFIYKVLFILHQRSTFSFHTIINQSDCH